MHPTKVNFEETSEEQLEQMIQNFDAFNDDPNFQSQIYDRLNNNSEDHVDMTKLRMRSGISPVAKNIINLRWKQKPQFETDKVKKVEAILKDLIDFGFSDHVDEQLLDFDDEGRLRHLISGKPQEKKTAGYHGMSVNMSNILSQENDAANDIIKDLDSVSSSNMDEDGMSSFYGAGSVKDRSAKPGASELNFNDSRSVSNFCAH